MTLAPFTSHGPARGRHRRRRPSTWRDSSGLLAALSGLRSYDRALGMNSRNYLIARTNPPEAIRLVNDKHATKTVLTRHGIPSSPTVALVRTRRQLACLDWDRLPEQWALKPNQGLGGTGILLAHGAHAQGGWRSGSGRRLPSRTVDTHVRQILDGEFSPRGRDFALIEPLIHSHPELERLSFQGLPDIRVICVDDEPQLAMLRLPTRESGGRANLHQRAIGAAVNLDTGRVEQAWSGSTAVTHHPDTGEELLGARVPHWDTVLSAAATCGLATGLHYVGADIVIDRDRGPLVLEVNARPGLQIQNVTGHGLLDTLVEQC